MTSRERSGWRPLWRPLWRLSWRLLRAWAGPRDPIRRPRLDRQLLARHLRAYGRLASLEWHLEWAGWRRRALLGVLGLGAALAAAGLAGVALMLWAVVPSQQVHAPWLLWGVPLVPAVIAFACLRAARAPPAAAPFAATRRQLAADLAVWRGLTGGAHTAHAAHPAHDGGSAGEGDGESHERAREDAREGSRGSRREGRRESPDEGLRDGPRADHEGPRPGARKPEDARPASGRVVA